MIEEQLLIRQLKEGKESAYRLLYEKHYAVLCHLARECVGDDFTAETLVSDVIFHFVGDSRVAGDTGVPAQLSGTGGPQSLSGLSLVPP